ncbi:MAG: hypothetical protein PWP37_1193 [Thermotogota bacterium]|nr:hypothetical protein [Thermotogota bacterium]MDK2865001.1 hypothetical protein [Thermotogota bacterium]HCZ06034.1 IMP cyclohydrolase [Thermotogota bacterium]
MNIKRVLISVSDKTGVLDLAKKLMEFGAEIIATEGTHEFLKEAGLEVFSVSELTGYPQLLDGRVKTLHPKIFAALLGVQMKKEHTEQQERLGIKPIDMVVVNLRPFTETAGRTRNEFELLEEIDIGGVALIRAAAKNYRDVVVLVDPSDYDLVLESIWECGDVPLQTRRRLALKAMKTVLDYDRTVYTIMAEIFGESEEL